LFTPSTGAEEGEMERAGNLSVVQAAARLGVSPYTLRFWAKYRGRLPYVKAGRRILFRPADLEAFEQANLVEARPSQR
jgi:excisionase family DNA binding protein